jgi:hypothetical protein
MSSVSFLRGAVLSMALIVPAAAFAQTTPAQPAQPAQMPEQQATVPQDQALQVQHQMGFSSGNNAAQGRYYDDGDQYINPKTGYAYPGSPSIDNPSGAY